MPKLIFMDENFSGQVYELVLEKTKVGRSDQNTLVIRHESVSSQQCEILVNGLEVIVRDLGSRNGTFVDGARLNGQSQVKSGQMIRFGTVAARLDLGSQIQENEEDTEETAVYAHRRAVRDQKREREQPKPANVSVKIESPSKADRDQESTILLPHPVPPKRQPVPEVKASQPPAERPTGKRVAIAVVSAIVLLALWWLLRRN